MRTWTRLVDGDGYGGKESMKCDVGGNRGVGIKRVVVSELGWREEHEGKFDGGNEGDERV